MIEFHPIRRDELAARYPQGLLKGYPSRHSLIRRDGLDVRYPQGLSLGYPSRRSLIRRDGLVDRYPQGLATFYPSRRSLIRRDGLDHDYPQGLSHLYQSRRSLIQCGGLFGHYPQGLVFPYQPHCSLIRRDGLDDHYPQGLLKGYPSRRSLIQCGGLVRPYPQGLLKAYQPHCSLIRRDGLSPRYPQGLCHVYQSRRFSPHVNKGVMTMQVHSETTMSEAFHRAGYTAAERLFIHISCRKMFQDEGATAKRLHELVDIAAAEYEGTKPRTAKVILNTKPTTRRKAYARQAKKETAAGIFMTRLAGKRLGNIRYRELDDIASKSGFEMRFAALLRANAKPANMDARLPEIYSPAQVAALYKQAKEG